MKAIFRLNEKAKDQLREREPGEEQRRNNGWTRENPKEAERDEEWEGE